MSGSTYDKVALELGYITMEWGRLEDGMNRLIEALAPLSRTQEQVNQAIIGNIDVRGKIQIVKALAFIRNYENEWFSELVGILDNIDNDLRARRNGYVHASWTVPKGGVHRVTYRTKLLKPKAFSLLLETKQISKVKVLELRRFRQKLETASLNLMIMWMYALISLPESDDQAPPLQSFRQFLRRVGYDIRRIRARSTR